jgi:hypothetical protein
MRRLTGAELSSRIDEHVDEQVYGLVNRCKIKLMYKLVDRHRIKLTYERVDEQAYVTVKSPNNINKPVRRLSI